MPKVWETGFEDRYSPFECRDFIVVSYWILRDNSRLGLWTHHETQWKASRRTGSSAVSAEEQGCSWLHAADPGRGPRWYPGLGPA